MNSSIYTYLGNYFIQCRLLGQRKPILAGFKITYDCNLACQHCIFWKRKKLTPLSFQQVMEVIHKLHQLGVRIIIFEGGEPFLWRDGDLTIHDVAAEARKLFFSVGITTNGTFPLEIPTNIIWVSLDGMEKTHNYIRGKSIFEKVISHIEQSSHPNIYANLTINRLNASEVPELIKYLGNKVKGITIQFHYPFEKDDHLMPTQEQRVQVLEQLIELKRRNYPIADTYTCLEVLKDNSWHCHDWMLANADPDGQINLGCYVKNRAAIQCRHCGFAAHTEISLAYDFNLSAILLGQKIFR